MGSFTVEPRNTSEQQICAAIEGKNWKTALKLVETKKKKKPDTHLDALEFYISCHHPLVPQRSNALVMLRSMADSGDAKGVDDPQTLELYDEGLKALGVGSEAYAVCKLRSDAVKANRKNETLGVACFQACLKHKAYDFAIQIASSLQANFKQERKYQFWAICSRWLYSLPHDVIKPESSSIQDLAAMRGMHANLAKGILSKMADQTPAQKTEPLPSNSLQTPQELLLYQEIVENNQKVDDVKAKANLNKLGPECRAAKGGWVFWRNRINFLVKSESYDDLFKICQKLLKEAIPTSAKTTATNPEGADWLVWKTIIWTTVQAENAAQDKIVAELIQHYLTNSDLVDKTYRRNAWLAAVYYAFRGLHVNSAGKTTAVNITRGEDSLIVNDVSGRVLALVNYFYRHAGAPSVFADLKSFVEELNLDEQKQFLLISKQIPKFSSASTAATITIIGHDSGEDEKPLTTGKMSPIDRITATITSQKFAYMLQLIPSTEDPSTSPNSPLLKLALENLRCYNEVITQDEESGNGISKGLLATDMHPADDWLLMSAMCLIQCSLQNRQDSRWYTATDANRLFQAAAILEYGLRSSKANAQFNLILVRLYICLGAGALAMRAYQRLSVKRIQNDTLGYILFDRISTLHPKAVIEQLPGVTQQDMIDPAASIVKMQRLYNDFKDQAARNVWASFQNGSYSAAMQIINAGESIRRSLGAAMTVIERKKIRRLTSSKTAVDEFSHGSELIRNIHHFEDNSDYSSFPNFEPRTENKKTLEQLTRNGPAPSNERTKSFLLVEQLWGLVTAESTTITEYKASVTQLYSAQFPSLSDAKEETVTETERLFLSVSRHLVAFLYRAFCDMEALDPSTQFNAFMETITCILKDLEQDVTHDTYIPTFEATFHTLYTFHELTHLIDSTSKLLKSSACPTAKQNKETISNTSTSARDLNKSILQIADAVKTSVDRCGQMDRIIDAMRTSTVLASLGSSNGSVEDSSVQVDEVGEYIEKLCDRKEPFLEDFAGELTTAWRDAVQGLNLLHSV